MTMAGSRNEDFRRAREGDREALDRILRKVEKRITRLAEARTGQELRARLRVSDIVQSAFVEVVDAIEQFRGDSEDEFVGWASTILENKVRRKGRFFRARKRYAKEDPRDLEREVIAGDRPIPTPSAELSQVEDFRRVFMALDRLPEDYRRVLLLRGVEDLSHREIAAELDRSDAATRMLLSRARVALTLELERVDTEESQAKP